MHSLDNFRGNLMTKQSLEFNFQPKLNFNDKSLRTKLNMLPL